MEIGYLLLSPSPSPVLLVGTGLPPAYLTSVLMVKYVNIHSLCIRTLSLKVPWRPCAQLEGKEKQKFRFNLQSLYIYCRKSANTGKEGRGGARNQPTHIYLLSFLHKTLSGCAEGVKSAERRFPSDVWLGKDRALGESEREENVH